MKRDEIEVALIAIMKKQGDLVNGQEKLMIRTHLSCAIASVRRNRNRMEGIEFKWKKPIAPKR